MCAKLCVLVVAICNALVVSGVQEKAPNSLQDVAQHLVETAALLSANELEEQANRKEEENIAAARADTKTKSTIIGGLAFALGAMMISPVKAAVVI